MTSPYRRMFTLTPSSIRRRFYYAFLLIGTVGLLEVLSLSALLAFFTIDLETSGIGISKLSSYLLPSVDNSDLPGYLLAIALGLFVLKAGFVLLVGRHSYQTATAAKKYFQEELFHRFLNTPFREQTVHKSSDWVRSLIADSAVLEGRFFVPVLVLIGEVIPAIFVCGVLLLVNAVAFGATLAIFMGVGAALYFCTHRRLVLLGRRQQQADGDIVQSAQQAFSGLRELTIYGLQSWVQKRFERYVDAYSKAVNEALFIGLLPKFFFEVTIYICLGILFVIYAFQGTPLTQIIGEFAVFAAAAMRLLPSVSKVLSHLQSLKHARPVVVAITDALRPSKECWPPAPPHTVKPVNFESLSLRGAGFAYGEHLVFRNLDLDVYSGESLAIIGASGSGKTTLINLILGLLAPANGQVLLNGAPLKGYESQWWSCLAYVPQEPFLMDARAIDNVTLGSGDLSESDLDRARDLIGRLDLPDALNSAAESIGEGGARLSGGQRQRLAIARALYRQPQVLILDEATSAMDVHTQARVMDVVAECMQGGTVLMITHRVETFGYCNKILTLPEGKLAYAPHTNA